MSWRSWPFGFWLVLLVAAVVFGVMLANVCAPLEGGDANLDQGFFALELTVVLWAVLAVLLLIAGIMGRMPRVAAVLAVFLVPGAGVAEFVADDAYSRHVGGAILPVVLLPVVAALYATWARVTSYHNRLPAKETSLAAGGVMVLLILAAVSAGMS